MFCIRVWLYETIGVCLVAQLLEDFVCDSTDVNAAAARALGQRSLTDWGPGVFCVLQEDVWWFGGRSNCA